LYIRTVVSNGLTMKGLIMERLAMNLNKLQQKADLWLALHGVGRFSQLKGLNCKDYCNYTHQCPYYAEHGLGKLPFEYKDGCIKWLDDEGFKDLTDK